MFQVGAICRVLHVVARIWDHPVLGRFERKAVNIYFDGKRIRAYEGDSIAAALWAHGIKVFGLTQKYREPRSIFCVIGLCTSCTMTVDGIPNTRTCIIPVRDGMRVEG